MIKVRLRDKRIGIPEDDEAWEDEPWEDAQDFHSNLVEFLPPQAVDETTAK